MARERGSFDGLTLNGTQFNIQPVGDEGEIAFDMMRRTKVFCTNLTVADAKALKKRLSQAIRAATPVPASPKGEQP